MFNAGFETAYSEDYFLLMYRFQDILLCKFTLLPTESIVLIPYITAALEASVFTLPLAVFRSLICWRASPRGAFLPACFKPAIFFSFFRKAVLVLYAQIDVALSSTF